MTSVGLTFDDGPDPEWTPRILDCLRREQACATFFVMAGRARAAAGVVARMRAEGHDVELHCVRHVRHSDLDETELRADTVAGLATLRDLGVPVRRWRPPWGVVTEATRRVAAEHGLELVGWDADSQDWNGEPAAVLHDRLAAEIVGGSVVLLHDGVGPGARRPDCRETLALLPRLLVTLRERGLHPAPLAPVGA